MTPDVAVFGLGVHFERVC